VCIQPARSIASRGALLVVPIAEHHRIAARAEFARRAGRHDAALGVDDLDLDMRLDARPTVATRRSSGSSVERLEADRAGFGHAVGDGDLAHVHLRRCTRFITSIGQGEPAMMPVRSAATDRSGEFGMIELGDEHGRHAVERGAALSLDRLQRRQRIEPSPG
jgi:hypothetical protein